MCFLEVSYVDLQPHFQYFGPASLVKSPIFHCPLLKTLGITMDLLMVWGDPLFSGRLHSSLRVPVSYTLASHVQCVRLQNLRGPELYLPPGICEFKYRKNQEIQLRVPEECP